MASPLGVAGDGGPIPPGAASAAGTAMTASAQSAAATTASLLLPMSRCDSTRLDGREPCEESHSFGGVSIPPKCGSVGSNEVPPLSGQTEAPVSATPEDGRGFRAPRGVEHGGP